MELGKKKKLPVYRTTINESLDDDTGISAVSFVTEPAIESTFVALSKTHSEEPIKYVFADDAQYQQMIFGAILRPDQLIYRKDDLTGEEYNIMFTQQDIDAIQRKLMASNRTFATNFQHRIPFKGAQLTEIWKKADNKLDKSLAIGMDKNLEVGTLILGYYIKDRSTFLAMKNGDIPVFGLSLEGLFKDILIKAEKQNPEIEEDQNLIQKNTEIPKKEEFKNLTDTNTNTKNKNKEMKNKSLFAKLFAFAKNVKLADYTTDDGKTLSIDDTTMMATLDGAPAGDGDYTLDDGSIATIQNGMLINITDPSNDQAADVCPTCGQPMPADKKSPAGKAAPADKTAPKMESEELKSEVNDTENKIAELTAQLQVLTQTNLSLVEQVKNLTSDKEKLSKVASVQGVDLTPEPIVDFSKLKMHERITMQVQKSNKIS